MTTQETNMSKVTVNDVETLRNISIQTFTETFFEQNTESNMQSYLEENLSIQKLIEELNTKDSNFYFIKVNNQTIGYLKINSGKSQTEIQSTNSLEIERIYVIKEFHGKNIGQILFEKAITVAKEKQCDYIWLGVWEKNLRAISFYKKNGFNQFDTHVFKLGEDEQIDILMKLELNKMNISENIKFIKSQMPEHVTLIAVSKTKPNALILDAYEAGQRDFGESYVQELVDKQAQLPKDIRWHFIGHLQSNKVKYIAPFVYLIHGVDSFSLLKEINKQAQKKNRVIDCLLQLYITQEETKFGLDFTEATEILNSNEFKILKNISIKGFMAMASNTDNEEQIGREFKSLKEFSNQFPDYKILSFGMSGDYKLAIEEGSTMIRVGSSIFGERNYNI